MRKVTYIFAVFIILLSCKETKKTDVNNSTLENPVSQKQMAEADKKLNTLVQEFMSCKETASKRSDCRNSITKMISEFYNISDFKNKKGNFVIYDSIQPLVRRSNNWKLLGNASDQEVLKKAQQNANSGIATIAIDISKSYGQIAMIVPGESKNSGAWKLKVPNTAALVNYNASKSFYNKALSYAFKTSDNVQLFSRTSNN